ncbi:Uncharacterized iron-regulated membrane protein [Tistlia consotensis]|uniref:Uncharacterized iron-regulated membrane protein n=1 Tax=Tistlia consotensis USBA 355 TaxID=560819 RepID=A0A1Y6CLP1_9PROT|nr:PepSY domain-containing protein [Tistlia consotensis]SMF76071.1 Uncharacterized iron-regulated membrane protein [Tistlia consotensis USBA 355]SNS12149.1 Uncharacterized iron-regulated membrane protein [Tistlia consotensis]
MMSRRALGNWYLVHKWTSLVCTALLLLLCVTGLPLIFYEEIDQLTGRHPEAAALPDGTPPVLLDRIVATARAAHPGDLVLYLGFDAHAPLVGVTTAPSYQPASADFHSQTFDARTGERLAVPPFNEGVMWVFYKLHTDLYAGLPGKLFLGFMGLLFVVALVSGVVVYGPFMRKLEFGTVRADRSRRLKWLDLHNLIGVATLAWALVVGATGVINTLSTPILGLWQRGQLAEMTAPYRDRPLPATLASIDRVLATAATAAPGMAPAFVAFPGTPYSSRHHYAVFMHGDTPLTARLLKPVLVDAETGALTASRELPWYVTALLVSQPLHFGDYGGLPLKVLWALLDLATIVVLASGLYLWLVKRRRPAGREARIAAAIPGEVPAE